MPEWKVSGARSSDGEDITIYLSAPGLEMASFEARKRGILVTTIEEFDGADPHPPLPPSTRSEIDDALGLPTAAPAPRSAREFLREKGVAVAASPASAKSSDSGVRDAATGAAAPFLSAPSARPASHPPRLAQSFDSSETVRWPSSIPAPAPAHAGDPSLPVPPHNARSSIAPQPSQPSRSVHAAIAATPATPPAPSSASPALGVARTAGVGADLQDLAADDKPGFDVFAEARVLRRLGMAVFVIGVCVIAVGVGAVGFVCVSAAFDGFISTQHVLLALCGTGVGALGTLCLAMSGIVRIAGALAAGLPSGVSSRSMR